MCGIFGYFSSSHDVDVETVQQALQHLHHRGPDQVAAWRSPTGQMGLGQTRLAINDLSAIPLPLTHPQRAVFVVANAEIYNHHALRHDLQAKGHTFMTRCDTEVIPHLYAAYGIHFIHQLRGEFAFLLWDEPQKTLFAVRDRFGIKPLYYTVQKGNIYFSSEIPALLKLKAMSPAWDLEAIYDFAHLSLPYDKTLFNGIYQIPPGQYLRVHRDEYQLHPYWDIQYTQAPPQNEASLIENIQEKLIESVNIRLKADVPVGCYLSGGIDSSALLGIASQSALPSLHAFTLAFDDQHVNEYPFAERTAQALGVPLSPCLITEDDILEHFERVIIHTCFPVPNAAGVARFLLSRWVNQQGFKTVLSGEGADEVFLGYWGSLIEASEDPKLRTTFSLSQAEKTRLLQQLPVDRNAPLPASLQRLQSVLNHTPSWFNTQTYFNQKYRSLLSAERFSAHQNYSPYLDLINRLNLNDKTLAYDQVQKSSYTWIKSFFPNTMLNWIGDRAEMAHGIESRQPYLDHELFELLATVPTPLKLKNGVEKYLLREAVKPFVTQEMYQRKKFMFQAPPLRLNPHNKLFILICDIISGALDQSTLYEKNKVRALLQHAQHPEALSLIERIELSYTLSTIASMLILSTHYQLS